MFHVENSGKGNCMYYAYSISLMYYLRSKNNPDITENIFNKLKLKEDDKALLRTLLSKNPMYQFTSREVKTIIEPILGNATRNLAAEYTIQEFNSYPKDTPVFTAAKYGLEFCFKQSLLANGSELSDLIDHGFTNSDFKEAEIYKMGHTDIAMTEYSLIRMNYVVDEFNRMWAIKEEELKQEAKQFTEFEIKVHKANLLDNILRAETVHFFLYEEEKFLNLYKEHLQKESVWGSEETLLVLHRAIQGERMVRNEKGTIDTFYDTEILLHIHRGGNSPFMQSGVPEIILNNKNNVHWTSTIPDSIFVSKFTDNEQKVLEILDDIRFVHSKMSPEQNKIEHDLLSKLIKQMEVIFANPSYEITENAIESVFGLVGKLITKLGSDPVGRLVFSNFLSALIECTPIFLAAKPIGTDLDKSKQDKEAEHGSDIKNASASELGTKQVQTASLSQFSHHTLFKKSEEPIQKTYPQEIAQYVSEGKQRQKGDKLGQDVEHLDGMNKHTSNDISITL